jgi:hypothetical protein
MEELLAAVDELAAAPMVAAQTERCSDEIERERQSHQSWTGCTQHFTTYIPVYRDVIHQIEREEAAIAGRTGVRVEPSLVEFSCPDEESWAFFADVGGFVETFTTPYRGLWRHAHGATTKIYETPRGGEGRPSGLWNVGDLDGNSSDEFVLLEAGRYSLVDVRDGARRPLREAAAPAEPMRFAHGHDVLLVLGGAFYAYRDGAVIAAPPGGVAAYRKQERELRASLTRLRATVASPTRLVSNRCDLARAGWSTSLTTLVGWSRGTPSYDMLRAAASHLAEHIRCVAPAGAAPRLDGTGGRDEPRPR